MPEQQPADELEELRGVARTMGAERVDWETPPPDLWDRIAAEAFPPSAEPTARVVTLAARRPRAYARWLIGAAAAVVVVIAGAVVWTRRSDDVTVLSSTELELLGDAGEGSAEIVDHDGSLELRLATAGIQPTDGFTEVWLINPRGHRTDFPRPDSHRRCLRPTDRARSGCIPDRGHLVRTVRRQSSTLW